MEKKNTIIIGRKRIPDMKFLELRQKDVINCNTGECLGFVLDLEFEIHTGKICYLIRSQNNEDAHMCWQE